MAELKLRSVRKSYGSGEIIEGIDLDVADREFVAFVGPSGCGKSTLQRMIAGLEKITAGDLTIDGARANDLRALSAYERGREHGLRAEDRRRAGARARAEIIERMKESGGN